MKIYDVIKDYEFLENLIRGIDTEYPFPFIYEFHKYLHDDGCKGFLVTDGYGCWMPVSIKSKKGFKIGSLLHPPLQDGIRMDPDDEKEFLEKVLSYFKSIKLCHRIEQPPNYAIFHSYPERSAFCDFGTFYIDLSQLTEEELFSNLNSKYRQAIRSAIRKNVEVRFGYNELIPFYKLYLQTMKRSKMYYKKKEHFERLYEFLKEDHIHCSVAYINKISVGAQLTVFTNYGGYVLYAASASRISVAGAIKYMQWENIRLLKKKGVKRFDFVGTRLSNVSGTKLEGIQRFKKGFGCELESGYLWKIDLDRNISRVRDELLMLKMKMLHKTNKKDIIDQENHG
ncbi:MAG TPA: peptidoglycan bridge formation glycyltransferase FemA/FemB family protein [Balneolales bacterium]|nr:peptidoglycan bridge formation glycyltransferase FemA/FemB family protein [Balneolales bacterium]